MPIQVPGPIPYAPQSLSPAPEMGMNIAQMMLRNASEQGANRSNMWANLGQNVAGVGQAIVGGMRESRLAEAQKAENDIRKQQLAQMQMDAEDRQAFSKTIADPSMAGEGGTPDFQKVIGALAGRPGALKLAEGYGTLLSSSQTLQKAALEAKQTQANLQQHFADGLADTAHALAPIIATNHDGGIEPFGVAIAHWKQQADTLGIKAPGLDKAMQEYQQASAAIKQANGDPGAIQAVGKAFQEQVAPMLQSVIGSASPDLQATWAKRKKDSETKVNAGDSILGPDNNVLFTAPDPMGEARLKMEDKRLALEGRRVELEGQRLDMRSGTAADQKSNRDSIAGQLVSGNLMPSQLSKRAGDYNANLADANKLSMERTGKPYNAVKAEADFTAAKRFASSLNGPQMLRFNALAGSVVNTIDEVNALADELKQGDVQKWNSAKRGTLQQLYGNTPQSETAARYVAAVNTLKEEFASLAQGGTAPTESAWKLASQQINQDYGVKDMHASLNEVQRLINYRLSAFQSLTPMMGGAPAVPHSTTPTAAPLTVGKYQVEVIP